MNDRVFKTALACVAAAFTIIFCVVVIPGLIAEPDLIAAFGAGFVNPFAAGYSTDVIMCWVVLAIWIVYEAKVFSVRHGWICLVLGVLPGVAVGFPLYLILRAKQIPQAAEGA